MADFMHDLPLSWRHDVDESGVTSDWRAAVADVMDRAAALLDAADVDETTRSRLAEDFTRSATRSGFALGLPAIDPQSLASDAIEPDVRRLAASTREGGKAPVRVLSRTVAAYLTLAGELGSTPELPSLTSGAVALYLAAKAPTPIRAVIRGSTLRARDAGWSFGRGPVLEDDAVPMLEFLLGRGTRAPRPAPR